MNDADLVRQTLVGRNEAYAELTRRWAARITAICHSRVRRADVADDMAQETFLRGFRALRTLSDPNKVGTWLMGIAHRACLDWLKASERRTTSLNNLDPDHPLDRLSADNPESEAILAEERRTLLAEVEQLPEELRQVIMLYYYDDLTYRDLAQLLGVSTATINARLTKARSLLRERLVQFGSMP